jgi:hypothetical protein
VILEQAFHALPEILCGSRYPAQDYEAGVVVALTMAILQELNGRNAAKPLSYIKGERLYNPTPFAGGAKPRYLRADLSLAVHELRVGTRRMSGYGWRHENWLEAKFFREGSGAGTTNAAALLADFLRLVLLVPETIGRPSSSARYLLHVYDRSPEKHVPYRRNRTKASPKATTRRWLRDLHRHGPQRVRISHLEKEAETFRSTLGANVPDLSVDARVTNLAIVPTSTPAQPMYWCFLTRIDSADVKMGPRTYSFSHDREVAVSEGHAGDYSQMRNDLASTIGIVPEIEEKPLADTDEAAEDAAVVGQVDQDL